MNSVEKAMDVIRAAMIEDGPSTPGSYAHGWHCNIAMACYDATMQCSGGGIDHNYALKVANESASGFMKRCFNVDTSDE